VPVAIATDRPARRVLDGAGLMRPQTAGRHEARHVRVQRLAEVSDARRTCRQQLHVHELVALGAGPEHVLDHHQCSMRRGSW